MNWSNPEERFKLAEQIGVEAYNKAFERHLQDSAIITIYGHSIRPVHTRFGLLYQCGNTGKAFKTLKEAEDYAFSNALK